MMPYLFYGIYTQGKICRKFLALLMDQSPRRYGFLRSVKLVKLSHLVAQTVLSRFIMPNLINSRYVINADDVRARCNELPGLSILLRHIPTHMKAPLRTLRSSKLIADLQVLVMVPFRFGAFMTTVSILISGLMLLII